ncbi:MAG: phytanoyl-CoA dioxygenase family protein, partial [Candidatus Korobacteraceae bacterium]
FGLPAITALANSPSIRGLVQSILGEGYFAVRAILFNKNRNANWKVAWHQDAVVPVKFRSEMQGWGPWSVKLGVPHVRPPASILEKMVTVRIHLDDCGVDNGPLRILPGTHLRGVLSDAEIEALSKKNEIVCAVQCGDVVLMRPLTVHASSAALSATSRRIVHIEFAVDELAAPIQWRQKVSPTLSR